MIKTRSIGLRMQSQRSRQVAFITVLLAAALWAWFALAQTANSNGGLYGGQDGLLDAILATPNRKTPGPQDRTVATPPDTKQAAPTPRSKTNTIGRPPAVNRISPGDHR